MIKRHDAFINITFIAIYRFIKLYRFDIGARDTSVVLIQLNNCIE